MKTIGVIANRMRQDAQGVLDRLNIKAAEMGMELLTFDTTAKLLPDAPKVSRDEMVERAEAIISLGGDGTMLYTARILDGADVPVIGVNLGTLGFMTSVRVLHLEEAMASLQNGHYVTHERTVMEGTTQVNGKIQTYRSLNECVLGWGKSAAVACIRLSIDDQYVAGYICDGMMVSTPTGSTGHSLSAGGPIVHPQAKGLIINFICPHSLNTRPIVVPDYCKITLTVDETSKDLVLAVDGQSTATLTPGNQVDFKRSDCPLKFIHLPDYNYYEVVKDKLGWSRSNVGK